MYCSPEEVKSILRKYSTIQNPQEEILHFGDTLFKKFKKLGVLSELQDDDDSEQLSCNVPNCHTKFCSTAEYENHYSSLHRFTCNICKQSLPSDHILDLHLSEKHDSFFGVLAEKKPMFACFLIECHVKTLNALERRDHCIRYHKFPSNFRFDKRSDSTKSLAKDQMDISEQTSTSQPQVNQKHFHFGHGTKKTFKFESKNNKKDGLESMVVDLQESLKNM